MGTKVRYCFKEGRLVSSNETAVWDPGNGSKANTRNEDFFGKRGLLINFFCTKPSLTMWSCKFPQVKKYRNSVNPFNIEFVLRYFKQAFKVKMMMKIKDTLLTPISSTSGLRICEPQLLVIAWKKSSARWSLLHPISDDEYFRRQESKTSVSLVQLDNFDRVPDPVEPQLIKSRHNPSIITCNILLEK